MIELMKSKQSFAQSEIQDGDIICFQVDLPEKEYVYPPTLFTVRASANSDCRIHDLEMQGLYSNPVQFYDFLQNRVMIFFRPKHEEPNPENPEFSLVLSKKQNYDIVSSIPFT
jgi:ubiquitin carboxyl-terminal hydrolase 7